MIIRFFFFAVKPKGGKSMEKTGENKFLGTEKISKLLLKFSIPCILSLIISSLYNIVDQIFIGNSEIGQVKRNTRKRILSRYFKK